MPEHHISLVLNFLIDNLRKRRKIQVLASLRDLKLPADRAWVGSLVAYHCRENDSVMAPKMELKDVW